MVHPVIEEAKDRFNAYLKGLRKLLANLMTEKGPVLSEEEKFEIVMAFEHLSLWIDDMPEQNSRITYTNALDILYKHTGIKYS
jgi:hypothetical protein